MCVCVGGERECVCGRWVGEGVCVWGVGGWEEGVCVCVGVGGWGECVCVCVRIGRRGSVCVCGGVGGWGEGVCVCVCEY